MLNRGLGSLFVVGPHAQHPNSSFLGEDFIDEAMLDIDAPRIGPGQISDQFFVGGRVLERIDRQDGQKFLSLGLETG